MTEPARFLSGTAEVLLRMTLDKLSKQKPGSDHYVARVYQALLMAHDAGFKTGVAIEFIDAAEHQVIAVIQLPHGIATFRMEMFVDAANIPSLENRDDVIERFLAVHPDMVGMRGDPYNGHCRACYSFKGHFGGECVEPECPCHNLKRE
jgi:hypothetical protein